MEFIALAIEVHVPGSPIHKK